MAQSPISPFRQIRNFVTSFGAEPARAVKSPGELANPDQPKDWTVLAYMEGRDRLSNSVDVALNGMEEIGSTDSVNLVAQATLVPEFGDRRFQSMGEVNTRRYYLTRDEDTSQVTSPVVTQFEEQKRLNGENLEDFLSWGIKEFPAKHFAVVLKKHGLGFAANGSSVPLSARELRETLERVEKKTGVKPDVLCWDSCNMEQWEVAYELKDRAAVMTGSPEAIPAVEFPYPTMLHNLVRYPKEQNAQTLGQTVVHSYAADAPQTTQFALDLSQMKSVAGSVRNFVDQAMEHQVPPERLYTNLMKSASFEPKESLSLAYNFRDMAGFLKKAADKQIDSPEVKKSALQALEAMKGSVIDSNVAPERAHVKGLSDDVGPSAFLPWKAPSPEMRESYSQLAWARDTGWDRFLDYTLKSEQKAEQKSVFTGGLGKLGLYTYKKYVSPYLLTDCPFDTSCSEYARIAIKDMGAWEGAKWASLRLLSCQEGASGGHDLPPGSGCHHHHHHQDSKPRFAELTLTPPRNSDKSKLRRRAENTLFGAARTAGKVVGGTVAGLVGGIAGAVLGGLWGGKAGAGTLSSYNEELRRKYGREKIHALEGLQNHVTAPGSKVTEKLEPVVGRTVARVAGTIAGGVAGSAMGLLGGALFSYRFLGGMAGIATQNVTKDALGELPVHYHTEQILLKSYGREVG